MIEDFKVLPIFTSHYSIGKSILTFNEKAKKDKPKKIGPPSIVDICLDNNFKQCIVVEDRFAGFVEADKNLTAAGVDLIFGIRFSCCNDIKDKSEASLETEHDIIVFYRNLAGLQKLKQLYSKASTDGFYYHKRIDLALIKEVWKEEDLLLAIPFYDSFLYQNTFYFKSIVPVFDFTKPIFFKQNNLLPIDLSITDALTKFVGDSYEVYDAKSIYYKNRVDFKAYMTYKCIFKQTTFEKPEMDDFASNEFCLEAWKELNG